MITTDWDEEMASLDDDDNDGGFYHDSVNNQLRRLRYFRGPDSPVWSDAEKNWLECAVSTEGRIAVELDRKRDLDNQPTEDGDEYQEE